MVAILPDKPWLQVVVKYGAPKCRAPLFFPQLSPYNFANTPGGLAMSTSTAHIIVLNPTAPPRELRTEMAARPPRPAGQGRRLPLEQQTQRRRPVPAAGTTAAGKVRNTDGPSTAASPPLQSRQNPGSSRRWRPPWTLPSWAWAIEAPAPRGVSTTRWNWNGGASPP